MVGPGQVVDSGGVGDDDSVVAVGGDGLDNVVSVPVELEGDAVGCFFGPGLKEYEADRGGLGDSECGDVAGSYESVVEPLLDKGAVFGGAGLDRFEGGDEVGETTGARATSCDKGTVLKIDLVVETLSVFASVVAEDGDDLGGLERKGVVYVLEEDGGFGSVLADEGTVVGANITAAGTVQNVLTDCKTSALRVWNREFGYKRQHLHQVSLGENVLRSADDGSTVG